MRRCWCIFVPCMRRIADLWLAEDLEATAGQGIRVGKQRTTADAAARHSRPRQAPFPDHDHRQPTWPADCAEPAGSHFTGGQPNQVWVGDITYIPTDEGWLFLAVVLDLFNRQVVGWSLGEDMRCELVIDAFRDGLVPPPSEVARQS